MVNDLMALQEAIAFRHEYRYEYKILSNLNFRHLRSSCRMNVVHKDYLRLLKPSELNNIKMGCLKRKGVFEHAQNAQI